MSNITPFKFNSSTVRVITDDNGEPWFVAKEIAAVLGYSDAEAMTRKLDDDEKQNLQIVGFGPRGVTVINEAGLYSCILTSQKEEAKPFKRWVAHDVLPSIRKTGRFEAELPDISQAEHAFKLIPSVVRAARMLGLDRNAAAISANQAVAKLTGANVMRLLGHTHLEAENQSALFFTPTELGRQIGVSGRAFNMLLAEAGLQAKKGEHWAPLATAEGFCRVLDTGKRHGDGSMIQQVKWSDGVLNLIQKAA
jgi:prophage antirepressor-like protein